MSIVSYAYLMGRDVTELERRHLADKFGKGQVSLYDLAVAARSLGFDVTGLDLPFSEMCHLDRPLIAHLELEEGGHFVAVERADDEWVRVVEWPNIFLVPAKEFQSEYAGYALTYWSSDSRQLEGGPSLRMREHVHDFGYVLSGSPLEWTFEVANVGAQPLQVNAQQLPDACRLRGPGADNIPAGATTRLKFRCQAPAAHSTEPQEAQLHIVLRSNDPRKAVRCATFLARVRQAVTVERARLHFGSVPLTDVSSASRTVEVRCAPGVHIAGARASSPYVRAQLRKAREPGGRGGERYLLSVSLTSNTTPGPVDATVTVATNVGQSSVVRLTGTVLGPLDVFPPDVFFGFVRPGENVKRTVSLSRRDGNPFEIKGVRAPRGILVAVCHTASSSKHDVTLTLAPNIAPGILKGNLELHTTVRAAETLRLPLYVHVLPRG